MKWKYCIHLMIETTELTKQANFKHYNLPVPKCFSMPRGSFEQYFICTFGINIEHCHFKWDGRNFISN